MEEEVNLLCEMFPNLPQDTLSSVWHNCGRNFAAAVDEALTVASLGSDQDRNTDGDARDQGPPERWERPSAFEPTSTSNGLATGAAAVFRLSQVESTDESARNSPSNAFVERTFIETPAVENPFLQNPVSDKALAWRGSSRKLPTQLQQQPPLPWEAKAGYVMGPGELGLLNELQLPRRGAIVPLPQDFLRLPPSLLRDVALPEGVRRAEGGLLPCMSTIQSRGDAWNGEEELGGRNMIKFERTSSEGDDDGDDADSPTDRVDNNGVTDPFRMTRIDPKLAPLTPSPVKLVPSRDPHLEDETGSGQKPPIDRERREDEEAGEKRSQEVMNAASNDGRSSINSRNGFNCSRQAAELPDSSIGKMNTFVDNTMQGYCDIVTAGQKVETASSADRIAAFMPGTRFRVAVDKGVTGLGITVKEIQGHFFVYRLQALADGSPGAAQEAGVQAGDELLGVEELDFETERWNIDQLVSYMRELVGVVILYLMRGTGPLMPAPASDEEAGTSHGVAQSSEGGGMEDGSPRNRNKNRSDRAKKADAKRLIEVLEEEDLVTSSLEAANCSRLYYQISNRAKQWDTGELWLSVAGLAGRPSPEVVAAFVSRAQPGEPPGWDESDSSEDEGEPQCSIHTPRDQEDNGGKYVIISPASCDVDEEDGPVDLDMIGTALLGQPLFSDTVAAVAASGDPGVDTAGRIGGRLLPNGTTSKNEPAVEGNSDWSPWPQLAALENKAARQNTVVPTRGLRKALNVRVLGQQVAPPTSGSVDGDKSKGNTKGVKSDSNVPLQSTPYLVWVMDVESGAEWRVRRTHAEFAELWEVCTGMRPSLARLDFPPWLPNVKDTPGMVEARRPRLEGYLQRLCSLLYMGPLHPSSAYVAHLLQDFLGTTPRVETLARLQRSRPERELRQALQVRAWQVLRLPPLERAVAEFEKEIMDAPVAPSKKAVSAEAILKKTTEIIERLQYVVTEGCFDELREMVRASAASKTSAKLSTEGREKREGSGETDVVDFGPLRVDVGEATAEGRRRGAAREGMEEGKSDEFKMEDMAVEDEALELISGSVRRQVEAEVFVPVMGRLYKLLRTEGPTARLEKAVTLGIERARGKPQSHHGIPLRSLSPSSWGSASRLLKAVGSFTLPSDKLDALVAVAHAIPALYRAEHPEDDSRQLGADDFLPIFIYVLVNSGVEGVASLSLILDNLCDPKKMIGEAGFCVATLSAAIQHLERSSADESRKNGKSSSGLLGRRNK